MSLRNIDTYLSDHLAGSVAALELLRHLGTVQGDSDRGRVLKALQVDIQQDQHELEAIMERLQVKKSGTRQAAAWLAEKVARFKLWVDGSPKSSLYWLEAIEALAIGIEGKRALWKGLAIARLAPELHEVRFEQLELRADEQRQIVELMRLDAIREALWADPTPGSTDAMST